jgi:hypothetical protein
LDEKNTRNSEFKLSSIKIHSVLSVLISKQMRGMEKSKLHTFLACVAACVQVYICRYIGLASFRVGGGIDGEGYKIYLGEGSAKEMESSIPVLKPVPTPTKS